MATQQVVLDYKGMPPEICCPACGRDVCSENGVQEFCEHVCLIHTDMGADVLWEKPGLRDKWEANLGAKAKAEGVALDDNYTLLDYAGDMEWSEHVQTLCDAVDSPSAFGLQVATSVGPNSSAVLVVFDFNPSGN